MTWMKIPVTGKNAPVCRYALVNPVDYVRLSQHKWHGDKDGYPSRTVNIVVNGRMVGRQIRMHQDILPQRDGYVPDHKNRLKHDNRRLNLRYLTSQQNSVNRGAKGVTWCKDRNRWMAQIQVNGKSINLGRFPRYEDALTARCAALERYFPGVVAV